jgi:hypothetical protein
MEDPVDVAHEQIDKAHEERGAHDPWPRRMAVAVSFLAASLALAEIGAKSSQTIYLTHHIALSDTWSEYQAKNLRATLWNSQAAVLQSLPNAADPAIQERTKHSLSEEARMRDDPAAGNGMKQLRAKAADEEQERDHAFHAYHNYEYTSGALEISIVLASVSVVTRIHALGIAAVTIGVISCLYGLAVYAQLV